MCHCPLCREKNIVLTSAQGVKVVPGKGVRALVSGREIKVGNSGFVSADNKEKANRISVYISVDNAVSGVIEFEDSEKKDSATAIKKLNKEGYTG